MGDLHYKYMVSAVFLTGGKELGDNVIVWHAPPDVIHQ